VLVSSVSELRVARLAACDSCVGAQRSRDRRAGAPNAVLRRTIARVVAALRARRVSARVRNAQATLVCADLSGRPITIPRSVP
jgi:hypothetical protein